MQKSISCNLEHHSNKYCLTRWNGQIGSTGRARFEVVRDADANRFKLIWTSARAFGQVDKSGTVLLWLLSVLILNTPSESIVNK